MVGRDEWEVVVVLPWNARTKQRHRHMAAVWREEREA
jgi:hypothetical protein